MREVTVAQKAARLPRPGWRRAGRWLLAAGLAAGMAYGLYVAGSYAWASYHYRLAQRDLERQDFEQALGHLGVCLRVWPTNQEICLLAARTARRAGAYDKADEVLRVYRKLGGVPEAVELEQALVRAQRGDLVGLEGRLWACCEQVPAEAPSILEAMVPGFLKTYRWPQARKCLQRWLELQPDNGRALLLNGTVSENLHDFPAAAQSYARCVELDPENLQGRVRLALVLIVMGQAQQAAEHLEWVRQRQPDNPAMLLGLARCRGELGQNEEAARLLEQLLAQYPGDFLGLTERGKLAYRLGHAEEAEQWLRQAVGAAPFEREPNYFLSLALTAQGKKDEAGRYSARLKSIETDQEAMQELFRELMRRPADLSLRQQIAAILLRNAQTQDGLGWLHGILQEDPSYRPAHEALARYYEETGDARRAAYHRRLAR